VNGLIQSIEGSPRVASRTRRVSTTICHSRHALSGSSTALTSIVGPLPVVSP
jgi:hypothetical protein